MEQKIRFKGKEYLLIQGGEDKGKVGAIATQKQFNNFDVSYAHSFDDGKVRRFNEIIGNHDDIQFV